MFCYGLRNLFWNNDKDINIICYFYANMMDDSYYNEPDDSGQPTEIKISYETLYELARREKSREDLQPLLPDFYEQVLRYIREKKASITSTHDEDDFESVLKNQSQLVNIKKLVREIYERRERKIINLAIMKARTFANITDFSIMLDIEKQMFDEISKKLEGYRKNILDAVLKERDIIKCKIDKSHDTINDGNYNDADTSDSSDNKTIVNAIDNNIDKNTNDEVDNGSDKLSYGGSADDANGAGNRVKVEFMADTPKFVGRDLESYGPFKKGDVAELPKDIADILLRKGRLKTV